MSSFINYIKATRGEWDHINWPSRQLTIVFTALVIVISVVVAYYLGLWDLVFSYLLENFILS